MVLNAPGSVINCIVMALRTHNSNVKVVEQGIQALLNLVSTGETSRSNATELNAYDLVRMLVTRYKSNPVIKEYGNECLRSLKPPAQKLRTSPNAKIKSQVEELEDQRMKEIEAQKTISNYKQAQSESGKTYNSVASSRFSGSTNISLASIGSMLADRLRPDELEFFQRIEFELLCEAVDMVGILDKLTGQLSYLPLTFTYIT